MRCFPASATDATEPVRQRPDAASIDILALPEPCYRCGTITLSIVGFLIPPDLTDNPDGFVDFELLAPLLVQAVTAAQLARWGVGLIKTRRSRYRPEGYLSNGCIRCDAIQGSFPLHEDLMEFLSEGGRHEELIIGRCGLPLADLQRATDVGDAPNAPHHPVRVPG